MDNKRFGKNKRSFNNKGGKKNFSSNRFSSVRDNRGERDESGSYKRFGSDHKPFSKDSRFTKNSSSNGKSYEKPSYSKNRDEKKSERDFSDRRGSYHRGNERNFREERENRTLKNSRGKAENRSKYSERRERDKDNNTESRRNRYTERKENYSSTRKILVKRKDNDERSFKADKETLQKRHYSKKKQMEHRLKNPHMEESFRLNRFIANSGVCSRREADKLIEEGRITVNGKVVTEVGTKVKFTDNVKADGKSLNPENKVYILLNKPKDFVTTVTDPINRKTVMDLIKNACKERVYPVGRLDRATSGLLLFTNDGELAKKLTHPKYNKKKIYHAFLDKDITKNDMMKIANGFELEDGFIQSDEISYVDNIKNQVGIEIHSGKNRIVRRIFEHLGYTVEKLDRVYFAGLTKRNLPRGHWRMLTKKEITMLKSY